MSSNAILKSHSVTAVGSAHPLVICRTEL